MKENEWPSKILEYIRINRVSSTQVADSLGKTGELEPGLKPILPGSRAAGFVHYAPALYGTNWYTHKYLRDVQPNTVVYVEVSNCDGRAVFGSLVSKYLLLYRQVAGIVVGGLVRDVHQMIKERYPIWCHGFTPIGCVNQEIDYDEALILKRKEFYEGSIIVADDTGATIIHKDQLTEELFHKLEFMEEQEDIWFDCIDRLKWDTFDTVCLKKYKNKD